MCHRTFAADNYHDGESCCWVASVVSNSVRPHRQQPTRLHCPWGSPGKNTGVGCHFLLQCMKVKSESEVAQSCPTLSDPMDCSLPGSSIRGISQERVLEWGAIAFSRWVKQSWSKKKKRQSCVSIKLYKGRWHDRMDLAHKPEFADPWDKTWMSLQNRLKMPNLRSHWKLHCFSCPVLLNHAQHYLRFFSESSPSSNSMFLK